MNKNDYAARVLELRRPAALETLDCGCVATARDVAKDLIGNGCSRSRIMVRRYICLDKSYKLPDMGDEGLLLSKMFKGVGWLFHMVVSYNGNILDPLVGRPLKEGQYLDTMFTNDPSSISWGREDLRETLAYSGIPFIF